MAIGANIRNARKALHMSQEDLAAAIGSNRVTISKYENGGYLPSVPALERLAEALHTTPGALSGNAEPEQQANTAPKTTESRIISECVDKMTKEDRERALAMMKAVYADYFDTAEDKMA